MHEKELAAANKARQLIGICRRGFRSEFHYKNWFLKHRADINALPAALRRDVLLAYDQATHVTFSAPKEPSK